jgi:D-tyrosyl-tRNA(Tyr) deacylase
MRVVLQRVTSASVYVGADLIASIGQGYLLLVCVEVGDTSQAAEWLAQKILRLRLYDGLDGKVNDRSLLEVGGQILVVSQFTLAGATEKGSRPDYTAAARPAEAMPLLEALLQALRAGGCAQVQAGRFGAHMRVQLENDGPVTLLLQR